MFFPLFSVLLPLQRGWEGQGGMIGRGPCGPPKFRGKGGCERGLQGPQADFLYKCLKLFAPICFLGAGVGMYWGPRQQPAHPQYANYWAPLTRKWHTMPHSAQPQHTNYWAPRTRKRHQQGHRPQRPTERSDPTQHAKGRTGDRPGPRKGATTRRNVTQGGGGVMYWNC